MKLLYLNCIISIPNEAGEEKIEKANSKEEYTIDYNSLGLRPPKGEVEYDEEGRVILEDEDLEEVTVPLTIPIENLGSWVASVDGGTVVYTKSNVMYTVIEEIWEIDSYLELIQMSWLEKLKLSFLAFFCRKEKLEIE